MGTADVGGAGRHLGPSSLAPPPLMPRMRDPTKGKGAAPPAVPAEVPQGEESDAALAHWLQQEEQMAETVWRGEDPQSLRTAQKLAVADKECLGVDAATLPIVEDKLSIAERMKRRGGGQPWGIRIIFLTTAGDTSKHSTLHTSPLHLQSQ